MNSNSIQQGSVNGNRQTLKTRVSLMKFTVRPVSIQHNFIGRLFVIKSYSLIFSAVKHCVNVKQHLTYLLRRIVAARFPMSYRALLDVGDLGQRSGCKANRFSECFKFGRVHGLFDKYGLIIKGVEGGKVSVHQVADSLVEPGPVYVWVTKLEVNI